MDLNRAVMTMALLKVKAEEVLLKGGARLEEGLAGGIEIVGGVRLVGTRRGGAEREGGSAVQGGRDALGGETVAHAC
jgi:hypothetical protein